VSLRAVAGGRLLPVLLVLGCSPAPAPSDASPAPIPAVRVPEGAPTPDASTPSESESAPAPEAPVETLPTPFTAAQIRDGMPVGTALRFRLSVAGQPDEVSEWAVRGNTEADSTIAFREMSVEGTAGEWVEDTTPWTELQSHAAFPAAAATRERGTWNTAAGTFEGWRYTVTDTSGETPVVRIFEFADALPGPPVRFVTSRGGEEVQSMVLLRHSGATSGKARP